MANVVDILTKNLDVWTGAIERRSAAGRGRSKKFSLYGIEKLRALILDLAVRGKLVPQDPSEEPASALLERIAESRKDTQKLKKKDLRSTPKVRDRQIPAGWCISRLDNIANSQAGFAFKSNGFNEIGAGLPLIRIRDVGLEFSGTYYSGEYREEFVVTDGDYLISMDGDFRVAVWTNGPALLNQRVSRLQFYSNEIVKKYVVIDLQKQLSKLQGVKAYTTVDHLSGKQISEAEIALPPLAEQHRIVAKVDELMALCDRLEAQTYDAIEAHELLVGNLLATLTKSQNAEELAENWARIETHFDTLFNTEASIDQLKQTILQLAVMGRLVPQDPSDEPASALLKKISSSNAKRVSAGESKKMRSVITTGESSIPFPIPSAWQWADLGSIAFKITDGTHHTPEYKDEGVPFLSVKDMSSGKLDFSDTRFISQEEHDMIYKRCDPEKGDLLITKVGTTGIPVIVDTDQEFSLFVSVALIKAPWNLISVDYLRLLVDSPLVKQQSADGTQGVGNKNLVLKTIARFQLPIAPLAEQRRIVAKVESLMSYCEALKSRLAEGHRQQVRFADAIASQAVA